MSEREPRHGTKRPPPDLCPHCRDARLEASLDAEIGRPNAKPVVVHVSECPGCGATRRVPLELERGHWTDVPGQGSLEEHR